MLGITQESGAKRYFGALKRLKDMLATMPGGWEGSDDVHVIRYPRLRPSSTISWPRSSPSGIAGASGRACEEYVDRLPEMADEIREMFPALVEVEQVEGDARDRTLQQHARRPASRRARRLPDRARDRPWRHGGGLRGRADLAGPPRGLEGPARPRRAATARPWSGSVARRRPRRGCTTPTSCRSSRSGGRATSPSTPCSSSRARGSTRSSTS